jgi:hypothetical protein
MQSYYYISLYSNLESKQGQDLLSQKRKVNVWGYKEMLYLREHIINN